MFRSLILQASPAGYGSMGSSSGVLMIILILLIIFLFTKNQTLVLKKFVLDPDNTEGNIVTIVARRSGFFSWLLTHLFKISPETSLIATAKDIRFKFKSISTEENALITLKHGISHIYCKYQKPFWLLVLAIIVLLAGIVGGIAEEDGELFVVPGLIISVILFLIFYFKKSILIRVETTSGTKYRITFKPSFIEGQDVNLAKAQEVVAVIQNQILKEQA
jgi:hypothetical protein